MSSRREDRAFRRLQDSPVSPGQLTAGPGEAAALVEKFGPPGGPAVMIIHGGFWRPEIDRQHARPMAAALAAHGWSVGLVEYPRRPHHPRETLQALAELADRCRSETHWVGHSAGGQLVLWLALMGRIHRAIALAAVSNLASARTANLGNGAVDDFFGAGDLSDWDPAQLRGTAVQPETEIQLIHGTADSTVPITQSRDFGRERVGAPGLPVRELRNAHHFDPIDPQSAHFDEVIRALT